jgi:ureidoglycolate hydrolase
VNYRAGTWHHGNLALEKTSDFLVLGRVAPPEECEEIPVPGSVKIDF